MLSATQSKPVFLGGGPIPKSPEEREKNLQAENDNHAQ
jgi:hypothetical protein